MLRCRPFAYRFISPVERGELLLERGDGIGEHPLMRGGARRRVIRSGAGKRQYKRLTFRLRIAFRRRQRAAELLHPLGLGLLELDVLALEPSGQATTVSYRAAGGRSASLSGERQWSGERLWLG
jgi:hypothetical protein